MPKHNKPLKISKFTDGDKKHFIEHLLSQTNSPYSKFLVEQSYELNDVKVFANCLASFVGGITDARAKEVFTRRLRLGRDGFLESYARIAKALPGRQVSGSAIRALHAKYLVSFYNKLRAEHGSSFIETMRHSSRFLTAPELRREESFDYEYEDCEDCDACAGTGKATYDHDLEVDCMECDGSGKEPPVREKPRASNWS